MSDRKDIGLIESDLSNGKAYPWTLQASARKSCQMFGIRFPYTEAVLSGLANLMKKWNRGSFFGFPEGVLQLIEFRSHTVFLKPDYRESSSVILVDFAYTPMGVTNFGRGDIYFPEASDLADFSVLGSPIENDAEEVANGVLVEATA